MMTVQEVIALKHKGVTEKELARMLEMDSVVELRKWIAEEARKWREETQAKARELYEDHMPIFKIAAALNTPESTIRNMLSSDIHRRAAINARRTGQPTVFDEIGEIIDEEIKKKMEEAKND